jgi:hypothetical protein
MKPQLLLTLLASALVAFVLPLASSARVDSGGLPMGSTAAQVGADGTAGDEGDEVEQQGTLTLNTDSVLVTDDEGGVTSCVVPDGVDLSALAGEEVEIKCEQVNGVWTVSHVESEDGQTEVEVGDVDHSGSGSLDDESDDNSGPGHVGDDGDVDEGPGHVGDDGSVDDGDDGDVDEGPGHVGDDGSVDDADDGDVDEGSGHVGDHDNGDDTPSVDDEDEDHSGPGGGGHDGEEEDD